MQQMYVCFWISFHFFLFLSYDSYFYYFFIFSHFFNFLIFSYFFSLYSSLQLLSIARSRHPFKFVGCVSTRKKNFLQLQLTGNADFHMHFSFNQTWHSRFRSSCNIMLKRGVHVIFLYLKFWLDAPQP